MQHIVISIIKIILLASMLSACQPAATALPADTTAAKMQPYSTLAPVYVKIPQIQPINCHVTADNLNVRQGPGVSFPVVAWLKGGDVVTVTLPITGWVKISAGWINVKYVECDK